MIQKWISTFFLINIFVFQQGCLVNDFTVKSELENQFCESPSAIQRSPQNIEEVVELINDLPKPVSVACFIASLKRPLYVSMTNNTISAQPANGNQNPRIFIRNGNLFISIVPDGEGAKVIEFSLLTSNQRSIKAELDFPVLTHLSPDAPYTRVRNLNGTVCAVCHTQEFREEGYSFTDVFSSIAYRPRPLTLVNLESFKNELDACHDVDSERCKIIEAFLGRGPVINKDFPEDLPVF